MFKSNKFICLVFLLLLGFSSSVISSDSWSRNDWFVFYGSLDSIENFITFESYEKFKGIESDGWNTYSWYDTIFEDKRWADSVIIDKINNRVKFYGHDFDGYGESGDSYDSIYLEFDSDGFLKEKIRFQEYKDVYSINNQTSKIDTVIRFLWDTTNLKWENESKSVFEYQDSKCVREEAFHWNDGYGWDDRYIRRYIYGSLGKMDSSFYTVGGASEILAFSYSSDNKTIIAKKYEQWNPDEEFLTIGQIVKQLNSHGKDSIIENYSYRYSDDSMHISDQKNFYYTATGNIEKIEMKRARNDTLNNYWKNEFYYNNQNQPSGFSFFIFYQDDWCMEDLNTTSYNLPTSNKNDDFNKSTILSNVNVFQNSNSYSISFYSKSKNVNSAKLFDMQGRVVKSIKPIFDGDKVVYSFDVNNIAKGKVYLLSLKSSTVNYTKSILIK